MTENPKAQVLHMLQKSPALVQGFQCVQPDAAMCTYALVCFSKGARVDRKFVRAQDLLTMGFRCSDRVLAEKCTKELPGRLAEACLHAAKYVPKYPHHEGVQQLLRFLCAAVLQPPAVDHAEYRQKCLMMVHRGNARKKLAAAQQQPQMGALQKQAVSTAWFHPKAPVEDTELVTKHTMTRPLNTHAAVTTNVLDEWRLATPRLAEIGYLDQLPAPMLQCMRRGLAGAAGQREEEIVTTGCHMLCMQTYSAPRERRGARARLVIMEEDPNMQAQYAHPDQVLMPPRRQRLTDARIAASFVHLLQQAMEVSSNPFAVPGFQLAWIDSYDYARISQALSFHWCTLRLPGRMSRPLHAGLWVTGQRNLDPRNPNTYAVPDML